MTEKAKRRENGEGSAPRKRADGRWQVEFRRVDEYGKLQRSYVYGKTLAEVRAKAKDVRERLSKGQPAKDKRITLDEFTETWIGSALAVSERKASTKTLYATLARKHIVGSKLGILTLDRVKPTQIEAWVVTLREKGLSDSTIRQTYTILRASNSGRGVDRHRSISDGRREDRVTSRCSSCWCTLVSAVVKPSRCGGTTSTSISTSFVSLAPWHGSRESSS